MPENIPPDLASLSVEALRGLLVAALEGAGNDSTNGHTCGINYRVDGPCACWKGVARRLRDAGVDACDSPLAPHPEGW